MYAVLLLRKKNESLGKTDRLARVLRETYQNNLMSSTIVKNFPGG